MLGHSNTEMTRIYAKVLDSTIMKEMSRIENFDSKIDGMKKTRLLFLVALSFSLY